MALSWVRRMWKNKWGPRSGSGCKKSWQGRFVPSLEALGERILPAVTATFLPDGTLRVAGDDQDNTIVVSRDTAGTILVNGAAVARGVTVANTQLIFLSGGAGNDHLSLD